MDDFLSDRSMLAPRSRLKFLVDAVREIFDVQDSHIGLLHISSIMEVSDLVSKRNVLSTNYPLSFLRYLVCSAIHLLVRASSMSSGMLPPFSISS